ncbi:SusC/RagA family TonB-linked outer membrane protein [Pedobacter immunditicola]|uniref:SusC/RagA family TonB-linked outer membrane protein n=1 Tax=Pedobacter immunditicola TaxID=3133440 RepID=UPI0030B6ED0C
MKRLLLCLFVFMLFSICAVAQQRTITGTVTGREDGLPIPGATIRIRGAQGGTQADGEGKYTLSVPPEATALNFSSIGYITETVNIGTSNVINASLVSDAKTLGEVVVTAQAIRREKRTLGYSAPTVSNEELTQGQNASAINSLTGRVAGVNITTTSNTPGASSRIVLRGGSSISGNNQALMVIDGVPIDNSSVIGGENELGSVDFGNRGNDINPDDIASVTVLKGPAAAALYGSRASNGALIITTKTGKKGADKTEITFSTATAASSILKLPDFQNEYGQGYYDVISDDGTEATYFNDPKENWSWGAPFTGEMQEWGQQIDGVRLMKPYAAIEDNIQNFFKTGYSTDNNLSFSGGGEKTSFYLGLNALNSNGIYPGDKDVFDRYNVRFNGNAEFSNKFNAGISFNYSKISSNQVAGGQINSSVYDNVLQTPRDIPLEDLKDLNNKYYGYGIVTADGVRHDDLYGYYGAYAINPYYVLQNYDNFDDLNRLTGNFNIGYKPFEWLNITERLGVDTYSDRRRLLAPKYNFFPADEAGNYSEDNVQNSNGSYEIDQYNINEVVHDLMVTGSHKFNDDFEGSLMIGNNIRIRNTNTVLTSTNTAGGLVVPGYYNLANSNGPVAVLTDNWTRRRLFGLYADLNLSYKNMLFLQVTGRNDWSSTLPEENQSFFYPSVSGSFLFTELLKESPITKFLDYGKIRASYAQVGNDTDPYQLFTTFARGEILTGRGSTTFPFGNVAALMANTTIGNERLKPEKTSSFEVGTELGFFDNRLAVDFSYYANSSKDQILSIPIANSTGYGFSVVNAGEIQNKGVELSLRGTPIRTGNGLSVELFATYTKNKSEVVELLPGVDQVVLGGFSGMAIVAAVGKSYGEFYGVDDAKDAQGRTIVDPGTGLPLPTESAQYLGSYNPKYQASAGANIKYKNLSMNVLFDTKHGGVFYSRTRNLMAFVGTSEETGGDRIGVIFPNSVYLDENGNSVVNTDVLYNKQDYYPDLNPGHDIVDATYVKLRTLSLSYTFNKQQLSKTPFGQLTIGLYGNNLFIWTPGENKYADPEVNSAGAGNVQGFDYTAQPSVRNYGLNVRVSF